MAKGAPFGRSIPGPGAVMPQGPTMNPFQVWLKNVILGPGMSSGGTPGGSTAIINLLPGFNFNDSGLGVSGEELGTGSWTHDVVFDPATAEANIGCIFPAAANVSLPIKLSGTLTIIAELTFLAGSKVGGITIPSKYTLAAGSPISLFQQSPADATLASIFGTVYLSLP